METELNINSCWWNMNICTINCGKKGGSIECPFDWTLNNISENILRYEEQVKMTNILLDICKTNKNHIDEFSENAMMQLTCSSTRIAVTIINEKLDYKKFVANLINAS